MDFDQFIYWFLKNSSILFSGIGVPIIIYFMKKITNFGVYKNSGLYLKLYTSNPELLKLYSIVKKISALEDKNRSLYKLSVKAAHTKQYNFSVFMIEKIQNDDILKNKSICIVINRAISTKDYYAAYSIANLLPKGETKDKIIKKIVNVMTKL